MNQLPLSFVPRFATSRRFASARFVTLFAIALGGACGGKVGDPGAGPGVIDPATAAPIAIEAFCGQAVDALCGGMGACCVARGMPSPEEACRKASLDSCTKHSTDTIAKGRRYDAAMAGACVAEIHNALTECTLEPAFASSKGSDACSLVFRGGARIGEPCKELNDCALSMTETIVCKHVLGAAGTCAPAVVAKAGEPCGYDPAALSTTHCDDGLTCHYASGTSTCEPRVPAGAVCTDSFECAAKLYCDPSSRSCVGTKPEGSSCADSRECQSDVCRAGVCVTRLDTICRDGLGGPTGSGGSAGGSSDTPPPPR